MLAAGGGCVQEECLSACTDASAGSIACQGIACSADYDRCVCAPGAALLRPLVWVGKNALLVFVFGASSVFELLLSLCYCGCYCSSVVVHSFAVCRRYP